MSDQHLFTIAVISGPKPINSKERTARKNLYKAVKMAGLHPAFMGDRGHCFGEYGLVSKENMHRISVKLPEGWSVRTYIIPVEAIEQSRIIARDVNGVIWTAPTN